MPLFFFGKQQIFKQKQNEGIVPNTTTRDMHTLTLSQGGEGKQNAQESEETSNRKCLTILCRPASCQKKKKD